MFKKLLFNTLIYGLSPYIPALVNILMLPILTKHLSSVDYGIAGVLNSYLAGFAVFSHLSITTILATIYYEYENRYKFIWRQAYGFLILWNIIYAIIISIILVFIIPQEALNNRFVLIILIVTPIAFFGPTQNISNMHYILLQNAKSIGIRTAIFGLLSILLNYYFIVYEQKGYLGWFYTSFIVGVISNLSHWFPLNMSYKITPIFNYKWKTIKRLLYRSLPLIPHQYSIFLLDGSEKVVLNQLGINSSKIGLISMATSFSNYLGNFTNASGSAFLPSLLHGFKVKDFSKSRQIFKFWQLIIFIPTVILSLWLKEIFSFLISNESLASTYDIAIILIMANNFRPIFTYAYNYLIYQKKSKNIWYYTFTIGLMNVVSNFLLVPIFGYKIVVVNSFIFFLIWSISLYSKNNFQRINIKHLFIEIFVISITTIVLYLTRDIHIIFKSLISILIFLICSYIFLKYRKEFQSKIAI